MDSRPTTDRTGPPAGFPAKRLLGQLLVEGEFISRDDLERALDQQKRTNEKLGEALVGMGVLDPVDPAAALSVQGELTSVQDALLAAARTSARIEVSATVLPRTTLTVQSQQRQLVVAGEDIRRGYIEAPAASRVEIQSNDPRG